MQKSIKTNDTVYSVPISTIRTYNRLVNEYEKCDESRDSLNSRIHTYQVTTEIQSIISKKNDSLLSDKDVIIGWPSVSDLQEVVDVEVNLKVEKTLP